MNTKVSVILPVNKDDGYLLEAVNSILNQSFKDFELLIIANNCTDELWYTINQIKNSDMRIKIFRLYLGGLVFSLNYGINIASGDYIARMDADDISLPKRLEKQVEFLNKNFSVTVLGTQIKYIDEHGNYKDVQASLLPSGFNDLKNISYFKCPVYHPTVMFRKSEIMQIGGYKFGFYGEDYELWLRCINHGYSISNLDEILLDYRVHSSQLSSVSNNKHIYIYQMLGLFFKLTKKPGYLLGLLTHKSSIQYLIVKTSKLRRVIKEIFLK